MGMIHKVTAAFPFKSGIVSSTIMYMKILKSIVLIQGTCKILAGVRKVNKFNYTK